MRDQLEVLTPTEADDVPARTSPLCRHGDAGYCADDALPAERAAVEALYEHAFQYALTRDADRAEEYAAWCARRAWHPGAVLAAGSHERDFETFLG